jgi:SAM-dependent methyltransferase
LVADYSTVTETSGLGITAEGLLMNRVRYGFAVQHAAGRNVLEVACGAGQGLGELQRVAKSVVAGDYTAAVLNQAKTHYGNRVHFLQLDAHELPFERAAFDTVIFFEALYYLKDLRRFVMEARRILCNGGQLLICTVNPQRAGFNPSPFSTEYYSATELNTLLVECGFAVSMFGAFPESRSALRSLAVGTARRIAVGMHLVPSTMRGKELLKRIFYGELQRLPPELEVADPSEYLVKLNNPTDAQGFRVVYALAEMPVTTKGT